ncbi:restriction endonuclease [Streptomyces avicenniae]|uniref:restriction endonuclease n=1 Tax=Streptomyces avicenniae TaxID=500153 RepID=UPI00167F01B3|nr:restriction endonuclease [Streptomyces avicenniae]
MGKQLSRREVHQQLGGNSQSGIAPTKGGPILLFTDPEGGEENGYEDGWGLDGLFYYSGEGQTGDQVMKRGNRAVLTHAKSGRPLHLFRTVKPTIVEHVGEFVLTEVGPWREVDALDRNKELRKMIIFRLRPLGETAPFSSKTSFEDSPELRVEYAPLEQHKTPSSTINPATKEPYVAQRRESELVQRLGAYLEAAGHEVLRNRIIPAGELSALRTDLFDKTDNVLVEAKGSVTRDAIRMAIGQLLDYRRFLTPSPDCAILLPEQPRKDLLDLCAAIHIAAMWPEGNAFVAKSPFPLGSEGTYGSAGV